jgi:CRP-like cAMP-binding protein
MASLEFLRKVPIFTNLKLEQIEPLRDKLRWRHYQRGEVIFHQDDPGDRMHIIVEGRVKISITSEDGREKDIALLQPVECFGEMSLLDGASRSATATAVEATDTVVLLREDFCSFFRGHPEVAEEITSLLARRLRNANQMLGDMVFLDVPTRLAKRLLQLMETYNQGKESVVIPLGQDELARLVGTSRETVSRTLNDYRRQGILTTSHRRIIVTNPKALERMASL